MKSIALVIAGLLALPATALAGTIAEVEGDPAGHPHSNDSTATAEMVTLTPGSNTITGNAGFDDIDFFRLAVPAGGLTSFEVAAAPGTDFFLALYDENGTLYMADDNTASGGAASGLPRIVADLPSAGTWYLGVSVFPWVPTPVNDWFFGPGGGQPALGGFGSGPFGGGALLPGEQGEFKLSDFLRDPTTRGGYFGDDSYTVFGGGGEGLDPPFTVTIIANPEPGTWALFALGFGGLGLLSRRRKKRAPAA